MKVSRGARRLFNLIHRIIHNSKLGECFASQAWLAERLRKEIRASVRSVKRWLAELVSGGYVETMRRPNRTSVYQIRKVLAPPMAPPMAPPLKDEPSVLTPSERKQAGRASSLHSELPPEILTTPGGRTYLNPEWQACRDALHASREEIGRARNRELYQAAIIHRVRKEWNAAKTA